MVKDYSDRVKKPTATTTWATFFDYQLGIFYMHHPTDRIAHTISLVKQVM